MAILPPPITPTLELLTATLVVIGGLMTYASLATLAVRAWQILTVPARQGGLARESAVRVTKAAAIAAAVGLIVVAIQFAASRPTAADLAMAALAASVLLVPLAICGYVTNVIARARRKEAEIPLAFSTFTLIVGGTLALLGWASI